MVTKSKTHDGIVRSAQFSPCRTWRYTLERVWDPQKPVAVFVLLNSSKADETNDDPTNRKGMGFARRWGCGSCVFVNLFAFCTPYPEEMKKAADPVGPENDDWIMTKVLEADFVVLAWGTHGSHRGRDLEVLELLRGYECLTLGTTKDGHPKHPCRIAYATPLHHLGKPCTHGCCAST